MSEVKKWHRSINLEGITKVYEVVLASDYDAERLRADTAVADANDAERQLAALREELANAEADIDTISEHNIHLQEMLTDANAEVVAMVESALRRSFSLGQIYWQQADSDSTCQQNKSDQTLETQAQHILNVVKSIKALANPANRGQANERV